MMRSALQPTLQLLPSPLPLPLTRCPSTTIARIRNLNTKFSSVRRFPGHFGPRFYGWGLKVWRRPRSSSRWNLYFRTALKIMSGESVNPLYTNDLFSLRGALATSFTTYIVVSNLPLASWNHYALSRRRLTVRWVHKILILMLNWLSRGTNVFYYAVLRNISTHTAPWSTAFLATGQCTFLSTYPHGILYW